MASPRVISDSLVIQAPPEQIFAILADPRRHRLIDGSGSLQDAVSGPDRLELGSTFGMTMKMGLPYRVTNTVVEFADNRVIAWQHFARAVWRYELQPAGTGTRVTESWDWGRSPFARPIEWAGFPKKNAASIHETLQRLSRVVTDGPPTS